MKTLLLVMYLAPVTVLTFAWMPWPFWYYLHLAIMLRYWQALML